jgi:hypothetical protein
MEPERCKMMEQWANMLDAHARPNNKVVLGKFKRSA